jgi:hypothetical protein
LHAQGETDSQVARAIGGCETTHSSVMEIIT